MDNDNDISNKRINKRVPGFDTFYPLNEPQIGSIFSSDIFPQNKKIPELFKPIIIRNMTFPNRIFVSPMCMYSSGDGHATDWHLVHIGGFAKGGAGAIIIEATSVVPEGRITPEDAGLWQDSQIAPLKRVVDFCHTQGSKVGVQLAHAGRKASTYAPWVQADPARLNVAPKRGADADEGGWPDKVYGPSTLAYSKEFHSPKDMTEDDMKYVEDAFATAVRRSITVGFDFIEVHCAHGYLLNEWLSPLSNNRTDEYGGSLENRMRFPIRILDATRKAFGDRPIMLRISATDFLNGPDGPEKNEKGEYIQWGIEQSKIYCAKAVELGYVDFLDISAAGNWADQKMNIFPGCQVPFATAIKEAIPQVPVGTVGLITEAQQAEDILSSGRADVVLMARELLRDPNFPLRAANTLGTAVKPPNQYERAWGRMLTPAKPAESVVERTKEQGSEGAKP